MRPRNYITRAAVELLRGSLHTREHTILVDVARLNVASGRQLRTLHYDDSATGRRMARLDLARMVDQRVLARLKRRVGGERGGSDSYVYGLDVAGQRLVYPERQRYRIAWTPQPQHLRHALAVSELYVELRALEHGNVRMAFFDSEPACWRSFHGPGGMRTILKPDASVVIAGPSYEDRAFVEIDRATESGPRITAKANTYVRYFQSGREQANTGMFPLVVWVAPHERRASQLVEALAHVPAEHWRLFAVTTDTQAAQHLINGDFAPLIDRKEVNP
jgi:hypothetical protein